MPTYLFRCTLCGGTTEARHPVSNIPTEIPCQCGHNAVRAFTTQVIIQSCPLSLHDQQERDYIGHVNQLSPAQIQKMEKQAEAISAQQSKQADRPSFTKCLDEARRELTAKRVDYIHPTIPG